eukprot:gene5819-6408_t
MVGSSSLIASSSSTASPARPDHHLPFPNSTNGTNTTNPSNPQATPTLVETRVRKTTGSFTVNFNGLSGFPAETGSYTSSPIVEIDGKRWSVHIYPGGDSEETKGYLSCFIVNESQSTIRASFRITLVNQMNWKNRTLSSEEVKTFAPHGSGTVKLSLLGQCPRGKLYPLPNPQATLTRFLTAPHFASSTNKKESELGNHL